MKKLTFDELDDLAVGCAILGSGGGGDPTYFFMMARHEIEKYGPVSLISISELKEDDLVMSIGFWGAPLIEMERIPSGREFLLVSSLLEKKLEKNFQVVMPIEIGGGNAFAPLMLAAQLGLPVLDADMMGRAFPEVQMISLYLAEKTSASVSIADCLGNTAILQARNSHTLEKIGRHMTVAMGSSCVYGFYPIPSNQISISTIPKSISKAIAIGKAHRKAKSIGQDPLEAILKLCRGRHLGSGKVSDIDRVISKGFVNGKVVIQNKYEKFEVGFQNEYLIAKCNGEPIATTPDLLVILEQETGVPIACESLQYGLKVNLIALPAPDIWTTSKGLALVGPRYFGYDVDYQPSNRNKKMHENFNEKAHSR